MKKTSVLCLLLCGILVGCSPQGGETPASTEEGLSQSASATIGPSGSDSVNQQILTDAMRYRLEYYEELTRELQEELIAVKAELYTSRVEYEAIIASLRGGDLPTDATPEKDFAYTVSNGKATLTSYLGTDAVLTLPSTLGGYPLVAIGEGAFRGNTKLTSVTVPSGVTSIDWFTFSGCVFLTDVTLGANVESIGYGAFENCSASLVIHCPEDSYAQRYARSYGIRTAS